MVKDKRVERELKGSLRLTDKQIKAQHEWSRRRFAQELEAGDKWALFSTEGMARALLWRGNRAIARQDVSGWHDVANAGAVRLAAYEKLGVRSSMSAGDVAPGLLLLLAIEGWSKRFAKIRTALDAGLRPLRGDERGEVHLAYFASFCAELMATGRAKPRGPQGPLQRLAAQATGKLTDKVLRDACEFQLKNSGFTEDDDVEFVNYELMPVWWFALARARKDRNLATARPDHPLFATPFAVPPESLRYDPADNSLLKRIHAMVKSG